MQVETTNFIVPYKQDALDGELGLTASDIAKSLGTLSNKVRQKLKRGNWYLNSEFAPVPYGTINENGVLYTEYILSTKSAKAFVARWVNQLGDGYLNWLLELEDHASETINNLKSEIDYLKNRKSKKPASIPVLSYVQKNLFDKNEEPIYSYIPINKATEPQLEIYKQNHRIKTQRGIANKICETHESGKLFYVPNQKLIGESNERKSANKH